MGTKASDLIAATPSFKHGIRVMQRRAAVFYHCPNGHELPHRVTWGRCSPIDCIDKGDRGTTPVAGDAAQEDTAYRQSMRRKPMGLEGEVVTQGAFKPNSEIDTIRVEAQSEEAIALARSVGRNMAREGLMEMPDLPEMEPLTGKNPKEWTLKRFEQLAPLALKQREFALMYGSAAQQEEAAQEILDRAGIPRKNDGGFGFRSPVVLVNISATLPYDAQNKGELNADNADTANTVEGTRVIEDAAVTAGGPAAAGSVSTAEPDSDAEAPISNSVDWAEI